MKKSILGILMIVMISCSSGGGHQTNDRPSRPIDKSYLMGITASLVLPAHDNWKDLVNLTYDYNGNYYRFFGINYYTDNQRSYDPRKSQSDLQRIRI